MYQNQIINKLIDEKIITISPEKSFTYASGMKSPIYTDLRLTISYPDLRDWIETDLANLIKEKFPDVTIIGGVATAGIPHAALVAEKLGLPQVTYTEEIESLDGDKLTIRRHIEGGIERVTTTFPVVITVGSSAPVCRPRNAKCVMRYKHARTTSEIQALEEDYYPALREARGYLNIPEWGVADVDAEDASLGLSGSPTKVKQIENIVFQAKEAKKLTSSDEDINSLIRELITAHAIG